MVQAGKDDGFVERCPKRAPHAVGSLFFAGTEAGRGQIALDESSNVTARGRSWDIGVRNLGSQPQSYTVGAICLHARGRFAYPSVTGTLEAGEHATVAIKCPRRAPAAINGTLAPQTDEAVGQIVMSESAPHAFRNRRKWDVGIRNLSSSPQAFVAGAVCTSARLRVVSLFSDPFPLAPFADGGSSGPCPRREPHPIAPIFYAQDDAGAGQLVLSEAFPFGHRSFDTGITNLAATSYDGVTGAVCVGSR